MVSQARHIGTFLLCRYFGTLLGISSLASVQAKVAKRAPSLISCLGSVDVHAGDEVDVGVEEVLQYDVAHADGGVDD